ncbi:MAG TPA: PspC domain-containing protein [Xanthomonadales bacterium]|nr:PspC domain-containing protein [Xanthomonadales bacterium]
MTSQFIEKGNSSSAMLAGVCSRLAGLLGWNVWAIRAVLLILLIAKPLWVVLGYAAAALLLGLLDRNGKKFTARPAGRDEVGDDIHSPELAARKRRIDELEQRFRSWEKSLPKD